MMIGISLWGDEEDEKVLRGKDTFAVSSRNYEGDPNTYYLYTITPRQIGRTGNVIRKIADIGLKVHMQLLSNDEGLDGFSWSPDNLRDVREEMDEMLERYPETVISCKYYHEVLTTGRMLGRPFGWRECPSVTEQMDDRDPRPKRLIHFIRWAADLPQHAPLLHLSHPRVLDMQGRRRAHELGDGQQARPPALREGPPELDRSVRDVCQALPFHPLVGR